MRSHLSSLTLHHFSYSGLTPSPKRRTSFPVSSPRFCVPVTSSFYSPLKFQIKRSKNVQDRGRRSGNDVVRVNATDDDSVGISSFDDWTIEEDSVAAYVHSSDSDGDLVLNSLSDEDLPLEEALAKASPVARFATGFSSAEVGATAAATLAFATIGLLDDALGSTKQKSNGIDPLLRLLLETAVGIWFSFWLDSTRLSSPYGMKMLVPLPAPLGLLCLGKFYLLLTPLCFVSMGKGVNITDGLDGLAAGTASLAFIGMSIAVLPICPAYSLAIAAITFLKTHDSTFELHHPDDYLPSSKRNVISPSPSELSVFGTAMAGACIGFLFHNQYKAGVIMGDTGSSALGGALAAMAACTGMFFPLFIASGLFVLEASSVVMQVVYFKATKQYHGSGSRLFKMAPLHHHLELCGLQEPMIVAGAYAVSSVLALCAAYIGLKSA
ncbi:hypothetical protein Goshw_006308 [Gossypium schwendimanii]|uniref:Phospho-N-acetylmuramoyl-pentapeptide-transferase n=1 Tax=Gossypium schwendimanii TaxID=34291 RepID=A0A7J9MGA4_GOSSC|nr:hypothetical protein [Gossypium schwendimanii]